MEWNKVDRNGMMITRVRENDAPMQNEKWELKKLRDEIHL